MADLRFVLRLLRRSPGFFLIATATLGLGIGANTAMFSLFYQVLLRSLPVPEPQRLVVLHSDPPNLPGGASSDNSETVFSYPMYRSLRDGAHAFEGLAARSATSVQLGVEGVADRGRAELVSGNFFDVLKVRPRMGRLLNAADDTAPGTNRVAVLSYDLWERRFGARSSVLNQTILLNAQPFTVIGVAPSGFRGVLSGDNPEVYLPISAFSLIRPGWNDYERPTSQWLTILGRLGPGITRQKASAELEPLFASIIRNHVEGAKVKSQSYRALLLAKRVQLRPAAQGLNELEREWRNPLFVLLGMASLLLLIACANLANLLAARATNRSREIGVRLALGATRGQIVRLLLIESAALALAGTVVGIALAPVLNRLLLAYLPKDATAGWINEDLHAPLLAFSAGLMILVTLLCGIAPALQAARLRVSALGERTASAGHTSAVMRKMLVAAQVALSLVLLACAGLFARSLGNLMQHELGFRTERVLTFALDPGLNGYDVPRGLGLYRNIAQRIKDLPGVDSVALADSGPLSHSTSITNVALEGYAAKDDEDIDVRLMSVGPGYFRTLGTPLIDGREFEQRDGADAPKVAVVNQAFLKRFFGGRSATGRHMSMGAGGPLDITIVGSAADVRNTSLRDPAKPTYYIPYEQSMEKAPRVRRVAFFVRATSGFAALPGAVRSMVSQMDGSVPVFGLRTMQAQVEESIYTDRLIAALSTAFGALAAALTAVGLYGVIAYLVTRRTREIGVRMALGASRPDIVRMILREVFSVLLVGGVIGLIAAYAAGRSLESQLFGLSGFDPVVFVLAPAVLAAVALLAASMPAMRASRVQPMEALRHE